MKPGDRVAAIDDDLEGIVKKIDNQLVYFTTDDGFTMQLPADKVVVIDSLLDEKLKKTPVTSKESVFKNKFVRKSIDKPVFDLHIEKIQAKHHHLNAGQMLEIQLNEVKRIIHKMKRKHYKEFVLIHGEGKGVLRREIQKILRQNALKYTDASYQKYGHGAILVII